MDTRNDRRENSIILTISLVALLVGSSIFVNILPSNPLVGMNVISQFAPQGFAFYSKSPIDDVIIVHDSSPEIKIPNSTPSNFFGLSRKGRAQMVELGSIEVDYPNSEWEACSSEEDCLKKAEKQNPTVINSDFNNLQSGEYLVYYKNPINWHWRKYEKTSSFDGRVLRVEIR